MLLTIGMATYDDFSGVWSTIQALRLNEDLRDCEIVVIDQNPGSKHGEEVSKLCKQSHKHGNQGVRHVPYTDIIGNAAAKNRLFAEARGDWVLSADCHILMRCGTLARLLEYIKANIDSADLLQGPCITAGQFTPQTHWIDGWGKGMWGKWAADPRGKNPESPPFEIDGMGGGLFCARRDKWLGFHPAMRGFGGESMYLQRKYIKAGRKVWCLPFLRWLHRYGRPDGVPFPLSTTDLARNLMIGHLELGIPLDAMREHYLSEGRLTEQQWHDVLIEAELAMANC